MPWILSLLVWLCAVGISLNAQESGPSGSSNASITNLLEPGYLEGRIITFTNRTDLSAAVLQESLKVGQQCIALRDDLARLASERAELIKTTQSASNRLAELNVRLKAPTVEPALDLPEGASTSALEQTMAEVEAKLAVARAERDRLESEPKRRADRRVKIAGLLAEYRKSIEDLETQTGATDDSTEPEELKQARNLQRTLSREVELQKIRNLNLELASYEATTGLVTAQQVLARRNVARLTQQIGLLKEALNQSRAEESAKAAAEAERASQRAEALNLPVVSTLAETNQQLARSRVAVSESLRNTSLELDETEEALRKLQASHESVRELVAVARESGVTQDYAIGLALRQEQYSLPSKQRFKGEAQQRAEQMTVAKIELIRLGERQAANADVEKRLAEIRSTLPQDLQEWQKDEAVEECRRLLDENRILMADLSGDYQALVGNLARLSQARQQWASEIGAFRLLIEEQVLWFRSTDVLSVRGVRDEFGTMTKVIRAEVQGGLVPYLKSDARRHPFIHLGAGLLLLALLAARLPLARGLRTMCPLHQPEGRLSLKPALLALLFTALLTLPIPATLLVLSWRLAGYSGATALAEHWSHALLFTATGVLVFEFLRQACRNPGLAVAHLRWPEHNARLVRFHFTWVILVAIPIGVLSDLLEGVFLEGVTNRMLFLIGQVLLLLLGHWLLRADGGLRFNTHDGESAVQKPLRLQRLYHTIAILIPLTLISMSALGYTYTARQIWLRVGDSIQWGLIVLLVTMMMLHWLTILRRRMAMQKVEQRNADPDPKAPQEQPGPDIWQVYSQSRRMFSALLWIIMAIGLYMIWADMLPALKKLDRIPIPLISGGTIQAEPGEAPAVPALVTELGEKAAPPSTPTVSQPSPSDRRSFLSVADVIAAVIVLLLTIAAGRNLPGFVEMILLSRVRFRQGEGYAIVTILRYVVLVLGIGWTLSLIGITWNKVQWLAAAVTVGIGFGLQEIFANFVSGLILLFERPVRVGDVITVGEVTGRVTRIQMRATTVRNWDQQELVLPNKDLITGRVINWTLTDDVSRLAITVGVSYGADVKRASELLLEIARANPNVSRDPEPFVVFDEFDDSTLNLVLRAYVSIEVRLTTKSALNNAILERFREAGIEIAYPQRDLHLRSVTANLPDIPVSGRATDAPAPGSSV